MLKLLQVRLQQYMNQELPDVQAGFRKGRGTRDQVSNINWIIEKAREFQKNPKIHVNTGEEPSGFGPDSTQGLRPSIDGRGIQRGSRAPGMGTGQS